MGNKAIAERISSARTVDLVSKFNLEELIDDALLESVSTSFIDQSGISLDASGDGEGDGEPYKKDFSEFNEQKNEDLEELMKDRVIKEINEDITTGFSTPDFFLEELKEPSKFAPFLIRIQKYPTFN